MERAIITVVGKDTIGIIAGVCGYLAKNRINILDISQTIVSGYFNMMMIVDVSGLEKSFGDMATNSLPWAVIRSACRSSARRKRSSI